MGIVVVCRLAILKRMPATPDSVGGTSAAGTSESASPEKWKDEDIGWFPKLSVQAQVALVKNPHRRLILYQNPARKHQNMGEREETIMLVGRR